MAWVTAPAALSHRSADEGLPISTAPARDSDTERPVNRWAILALILGIAVPLGGIVVGHVSLRQIKRSGERGRGLALAGTILGYSLTALEILFAVLLALLAAAATGASR
ncbi:DUF4190 domain-containing protein [Galbitalea soli]|uniref:DUF4190 domain-containing protein n=1 Tax=Galbitalea soli TaxID=1268042 RepID=A0A7C9TQZ8_9MICO|nr:DUF4190 domain-containing protein [Galbitalea soli]NYJ29950.1 hypothetical protein [Galbitalea soli]